MDLYRERRQRSIFVSVFLISLVLTIVFAFVTNAFAAPGDSEAEPVMDGYETFPVAFRCPDVPHEAQTCVPGLWYFGSLIGSSDYDDWIGAHASSNKWQTKYELNFELLATTKELLQGNVDLYKGEVVKLRTDLNTMSKVMRWNSTVAFVAGAIVFTALTVALTAIIYKTRNGIEDTVSGESGIQAQRPVLGWRFP